MRASRFQPALVPLFAALLTLGACSGGGGHETAPPSPTAPATVPATTTATASGTPSASPSPTATLGGPLSIADTTARDARGVALRLGQTVTTEGIVTVAAGVFANAKLKIFLQADAAGIMVYHQTSAGVPAFQAGQRLRVTGVIRQADPSGGDNPTSGTVLVDVTAGLWTVLDDDNPLPPAISMSIADIEANGTVLTGALVRLSGLRKTGGQWPKLGDKSTDVTVGDDDGRTLPMRFQRATITPELVDTLAAIGAGPFDATAVLVQDDPNPDGTRLGGFQLWPRGAADIEP